MFALPITFARLLNPGAMLTKELKMKIYNYEMLKQEKTQLEQEISALRKEQDTIENSLAEAYAEVDFQRCLSGQLIYPRNDTDLENSIQQHLSIIIRKLGSIYERKLYLDVDLQKQKSAIEKDIVKVNAETAAAAEAGST
ncbi:uncharacterized protein LOC6561884 [Drosophila grimshawi]|uniref:GH10092 n=1 Tax=Drosophila grimshawi TaxID=7222 RepID=B4JCZ6_DROGR|nr:uncharacterized protein LOC6561884 [Drosophila grimshawi]EDW04240.1 GH10092 [Drosophila grimshawi]